MTEPPAEYKGFLETKRMQALEIGQPALIVGALVASLAAAINNDFIAVVPTLQGCAVLGAISALVSFFAKRFQQETSP